MPTIFPDLSNEASIWIFQSNQVLKEDQIKYIQSSLNDFIPDDFVIMAM